MRSCQKPIGAPCPWDIVPPWRDITPTMCEACGCLWYKEEPTELPEMENPVP